MIFDLGFNLDLGNNRYDLDSESVPVEIHSLELSDNVIDISQGTGYFISTVAFLML